jgi:hypothetical protein
MLDYIPTQAQVEAQREYAEKVLRNLKAATKSNNAYLCLEHKFKAILIYYHAKRTGHISRKLSRFAAQFAEECFCGKKALYRYGQEGRCKEHKMVATRGFAERTTRLEQRAAETNQLRDRYDQALRTSDRLKKLSWNR